MNILVSISVITLLLLDHYHRNKTKNLELISLELNRVNCKFESQIAKQTEIIQKMDGWQQEAVVLHSAHIPLPTFSLILKKIGYEGNAEDIESISMVPVKGISLTYFEGVKS